MRKKYLVTLSLATALTTAAMPGMMVFADANGMQPTILSTESRLNGSIYSAALSDIFKPSTEYTENNFKYTVTNDEATITGLDNADISTDIALVIPNTLGGYAVKRIAANAFAGNTNIKSVSFGTSVEVIGFGAFTNCTNLTGTITIPANITNIQDGVGSLTGVFYGTAVEEVVVEAGEDDLSIGMYAFAGCESLKKVTLSDRCSEIKSLVFYGDSSLAQISIPKSVTRIGESAFGGCDALADVYYDGTEDEYKNNCTVGTGNDVLDSATWHYTDNSSDNDNPGKDDSDNDDNNSGNNDSDDNNSGDNSSDDNNSGNNNDPVPDTEIDSSYTGWKTVGSKEYWYENGVLQGTEGRGKEIYDKDSDAWYWLDAVQNGAKAVSKDVYQESLAGDWGDSTDADGNKIGKWVRYDENGHMVKGWQNTDAGTYYFDNTYGTMAKGDVEIDGKSYSFDTITGVLKVVDGSKDDDGNSLAVNGWHKINGVKYWYENGVRQGYNPSNPNYRGKEIYDPDSNAWYWLDNVQQGAMAVDKDVYQNSAAGDWGETAGEDGSTYGKWVRYDSDGHMVKGWDEKNGNTYYFDLTYGTMAKGDVVIDGVTYHFDESTGILQ